MEPAVVGVKSYLLLAFHARLIPLWILNNGRRKVFPDSLPFLPIPFEGEEHFSLFLED
jgi:hypothetical protein